MASQPSSQEIDLESVGMHVEASYEKTLRLRIKELLNCSTENFPGAVPAMLDKEKLSFLKEEDYFVCEKSDGVRYMMLSVYTALGPATFLIDRNNTYRYIESFLLPCKDNPGKYHHETLLDGELVINRDRETKQKTIKYLVFDLLVHNSNVITKRPLNSRLGLLRQEIIEPFEQSLLNPEVSKKVPFMINLKRVERSYGMSLILASLPLLDHSSDGLIFTPVSFPYKPGSCSKLLKWKPAEQITADFRILVTHNPDRKPVYQLQVASGSANKFFSPLQLPSEIYTKWRAAPPDGKIAEFRWDPSWAVTTAEKGYAPQTVKGGWVFVRLRPDKKVPNDEAVARSAIRAIEDGVSREMLEESTDLIRACWKERERIQDGHPPSMTSKPEASKSSTDCMESKDGEDFDVQNKDDITDISAKLIKEDVSTAPAKEHFNGGTLVLDTKVSEASSPRELKSIPAKVYLKPKLVSPTLPIKPASIDSHFAEVSNGINNVTMQVPLEKVKDLVLPEKTAQINQGSIAEKVKPISSGTRKSSRAKAVTKPPPGEPMEADLPRPETNNREDGKRAGSVSILEFQTPRKISRRQFSDSNIDIELTTNFSQEASFKPQEKLDSHENNTATISQENANPDPITHTANDQTKAASVKSSVSPALRLEQVMNQKGGEPSPRRLPKKLSNKSIPDTNSMVSLKAVIAPAQEKPKHPSLSPAVIQATNDVKNSLVLPINNGHKDSKIIESKEITESPTAIKSIPQPPKRSSNLFALMSPTNSEPSYPVNDSVSEVDPKATQEAFSDTPVLVASSTKKFPNVLPQLHSEMVPPLRLLPPSFIRPNNPVQQSPSGSGSVDLSDTASPLLDKDSVSVDRKNRNKKTSGIAHLLNGNSNTPSHSAPYNNSAVTPKKAPDIANPTFSPNLPVATTNFKETESNTGSNIGSGGPSLVPRPAPNSFRPEREITVPPPKISEPESAKVINPPPDNGTIPSGLPRNPVRLAERPNYSEKAPSRPALRPSRTAVRPEVGTAPPRTLPYSTQSSTVPGPQGGNYLYGSMGSLGTRPQMMSQPIAPSQPNVTHQQISSRDTTMRRGSNNAHYYRPPYPDSTSVTSSGVPPGMRRSSLSQSGWGNGRPEPYPTQSLHGKYSQSTYPGIASRPINLPPGSMPSSVPSNGAGLSMFSRPGPPPSHNHTQGHPTGHPQSYPQQGHPQGYPVSNPQGYLPNHHPGHLAGLPPGSMAGLPPGFHSNPPLQTTLPNHPQGALQGHHSQPMRPKPYPTLPGQVSQPYSNLPHSQPYPMGYNQYPYQQQPNQHHPTSGQMYPSQPFQSPHPIPPNQNAVPSQKPPSQPPSGSSIVNPIPPASAPPPQSRQSKGMLDFIMNP